MDSATTKPSKLTLGDLVKAFFLAATIILIVVLKESPEYQAQALEISAWIGGGIIVLILAIIFIIFLLWLSGKAAGKILLSSILVFAVGRETGGWTAFVVGFIFLALWANSLNMERMEKRMESLSETSQ